MKTEKLVLSKYLIRFHFWLRESCVALYFVFPHVLCCILLCVALCFVLPYCLCCNMFCVAICFVLHYALGCPMFCVALCFVLPYALCCPMVLCRTVFCVTFFFSYFTSMLLRLLWCCVLLTKIYVLQVLVCICGFPFCVP